MFMPSLVATSERFADWSMLLDAWVVHVNRYCATIANDNPYWHGEQTNVAFLTGVAFQLTNWFALTEFPSAKESPELIHAYGRNDAWLKSTQDEYFIEAKHGWLELDRHDGVAIIPGMLAAATQAAERISLAPPSTTLGTHAYRVALIFICPRYTAHPDFVVDQALHHLQRYIQQQSYDALAWTFPPQADTYTSVRTGKRYPGIILLAKAL